MNGHSKVLIVDPNGEARTRLKAELERHACQVQECESITTLCECIDRFQPNIVFVSLDGAADGAICVRQSAVHASSPLVVGYASSERADAPAQAVRGGAHDFLTTPFEVDDLKGTIYRLSTALSKRSSKQFDAGNLSNAFLK